jgi:hypothetical protein
MRPIRQSVSPDSAFYKRTAKEWGAMFKVEVPENMEDDLMTRKQFVVRAGIVE